MDTEEENCPTCGDPFPLETLVYHVEKCKKVIKATEEITDPDLLFALKLQREEEAKKYIFWLLFGFSLIVGFLFLN